VDVLAALEAYYIQDQFIPLHQLILDDTIKTAEGAFGEVRHGTYLGVDVAAKRAKPQNSQERKGIYKAFLHEAKILSELGHHSNIVKFIGISPMLEDEFYIVMEYCDGGNALTYLSKIRREQEDPQFFRTVVKLCMGVCDAMHFFHSKGYTHRDINITNIMVKFSNFAMLFSYNWIINFFF
jgi:serine/threonine protein kinase